MNYLINSGLAPRLCLLLYSVTDHPRRGLCSAEKNLQLSTLSPRAATTIRLQVLEAKLIADLNFIALLEAENEYPGLDGHLKRSRHRHASSR